MSTILQFMVSGTLGPVRLGTSHSDVVKAWAQPDDVSESRPLIAKYGPIEVAFSEHIVRFLAVYTRYRYARSPLPLVWDVDESTTRATLEEKLDNLGVAHEPVPGLSFAEQEAIKAKGSGVVAIFADGRLDSLQLSE